MRMHLHDNNAGSLRKLEPCDTSTTVCIRAAASYSLSVPVMPRSIAAFLIYHTTRTADGYLALNYTNGLPQYQSRRLPMRRLPPRISNNSGYASAHEGGRVLLLV